MPCAASRCSSLRTYPPPKLGSSWRASTRTRLYDVTVQFKPEATGEVKFRVRDIALIYDPATHTIARGKNKTVIHPGASLGRPFPD